MFAAEFEGERILKIGQHLENLWARVGELFFCDSWGRMQQIVRRPGSTSLGSFQSYPEEDKGSMTLSQDAPHSLPFSWPIVTSQICHCWYDIFCVSETMLACERSEQWMHRLELPTASRETSRFQSVRQMNRFDSRIGRTSLSRRISRSPLSGFVQTFSKPRTVVHPHQTAAIQQSSVACRKSPCGCRRRAVA